MAKNKGKTEEAPASTELVHSPVTTGALATTRQAPEGFENFGPTDLVLARLGLCQSMTPQRKKGDARFIPELEEGEFFNSLSGKIYGEKVKIIPVHYFKTRIRWRGDIGEGIQCRSFDWVNGLGDPGGSCLTCPLAQFGKDGEAPECTDFMNFAALVIPDKGAPTLEDLLIVSFKSTGITVAKNWISRARLQKDVKTNEPLPIFGGIYELSSVEDKRPKGTFYQYVVNNAGQTTPDQRNFAREFYAMVKSAVDKRDEGLLKTLEREPGEDPEPTGKSPF